MPLLLFSKRQRRLLRIKCARQLPVFTDFLIDRAIDGRDMLAALSGYTIRKQRAERGKGEGRENFRPVNPEDYVMVQRIMDGGAIYRNNYTRISGDQTIIRIGYARDDEGKLWTAVWKRTADGQVFLTSLHRVKERDLAGAERRLGPPIKRERK